MIRYAVRRVLVSIPLIWALATLTFFIVRLAPGDPLAMYYSPEIDPSVMETVRARLGLDQPIHVQYVKWLAALVQGELGVSFAHHRPVTEILAETVPNTLALTVWSLLMILVVGVAGDEASLGYFGFAYFVENTERLDAVEINGGAGCVAPTRETIEDGSYSPLSRPMFIYAKAESLERPVVAEFLRFWMEHSGALVPEVGYVPLSDAEYDENLATLEVALGAGDAGETVE